MIPPNDVVADLPAPLDDEPPSVRQDIADELADHLACAYRRELLKTADERTAQQRVLDRFGDPRRIAYQLWFQALWGRIMLSRFARVWQGLKIVGGLLVLFFVVRMAEQQAALHNQVVFMTANYNTMQSQTAGTRMLLEQMLARLPAPPPTPEGSGMSSMGMPGMMGTGSGGGNMPMGGGGPGMMPGMPGPAPMMGTGLDGGGGPMIGTSLPPAGTETSAPQEPGLIVRLTMEGTDKKPASGCVVSVISEQGEQLTPMPISQQPGTTPGMSQTSGGFFGSEMAFPSHGLQTANLQSNTDKFGYVVTPEMNGEIRFTGNTKGTSRRLLEPGRYSIVVEFPDGLHSYHRFVVSPSAKPGTRLEQIDCPETAKNAYINIHTPILPQDVIDAEISLRIQLMRQTSIHGKEVWHSMKLPNCWILGSDAVTGAVFAYNSFNTRIAPGHRPQLIGLPGSLPYQLQDLPAEDRFLAIPEGSYQVWIHWIRNTQPPPGGNIQEATRRFYPVPKVYPAAGAAKDGMLEITADTRDVLLDLPEGMLEDLRKVLKPVSPDNEPAPPADATKVPEANP